MKKGEDRRLMAEDGRRQKFRILSVEFAGSESSVLSKAFIIMAIEGGKLDKRREDW